MKKKIAVILLAVLAVLGTAVYGGIQYFRNHYVVIEDAVYSNQETELDLSGVKHPDYEQICQLTQLEKLNLLNTEASIEEYERLRAALPECRILWQLPFQGRFLELDTKEITVNSLTDEEIDDLHYLTQLQAVDATGCADLERIMKLRQRYPRVQVKYRVPVGDRMLSCTTVNLMVANPDPGEVGEALQYLPDLQKVTFTGKIADRDGILGLEEAYPEITFLWNVEVAGKKFLNTSQEIDLSGVQVEDLEEVAASYPYFDNLEKVILCDCGKTSEELDAFWKKYPQVRVVWSVPIRFFTVRTDITTLMPYQYGCAKLSNKDVDSLKYLVDLVCVDFGHMDLTDLSFLEYTPNIEYLIIADSGVRDITPVGHLKKLKYLEMFLNRVQDISALANCTELRDLNMCYNGVTDITPLLELKHLEHLWMKGVNVSGQSLQLLEETFPELTIMISTYNPSSTGNGWRKIPGYYEQRDLLGMWYTNEN